MAIFIELTTDAFDSMRGSGVGGDGLGTGLESVRRPLRGLEIKDDTYAYIKVIQADGTPLRMMDSSNWSGQSSLNSNFILQSVQETRMERHQVLETFGDTYLFMFGESPRFLQVQAVLLNSLDFNWEAEFEYNYDNFLRGTKCIEKGARCYLFYDDSVVEGYILNAVKQKNSSEPLSVQLSFQFFVTNCNNVSMLENGENFPIRKSATLGSYDIRQKLSNEDLDSVVSNVLGPNVLRNKWFDSSGPLRGKIADNRDEYTSPQQPEWGEISSASNGGNVVHRKFYKPVEVHSLGEAISELLQGHSITANLFKPVAWSWPDPPRVLGLSPMFQPIGFGIGPNAGQFGPGATFGPFASAGAGGFAGLYFGASVSASVSAHVGIGASVGAYAGVSVGASAHAGASAYAGGSAGLAARSYAGVYSGTYYGTDAYANTYPFAYGNSFGFNNNTSRLGGQASAYASAHAGVSAGFNSYAYTGAGAAAGAGGYAGAGSYMGAPGFYPGASYAGSSGAGASVAVGGAASAFSLISVNGNLTNQQLTSRQAMATAPGQWGWSDSWSWPSAS